jgi:hypothetical protein
VEEEYSVAATIDDDIAYPQERQDRTRIAQHQLNESMLDPHIGDLE